MAATISSRSRGMMSRLCVGCGGQIHDQYILRVAPNLEWHAACLKCCECKKFLDESCTCFVREGKIYCKDDYLRLFGTKCEKCHHSFGKNDFVMRAKNKIFHLECFRCIACQKQLIPGEEFALQNDGTLFCKEDTRHIGSGCNISDKSTKTQSEENNNSQDKIKRENNEFGEDDEDDDNDIRKGEDSIDPDDEMMSIKSEDEFGAKNDKCDSSSFVKLYDGKNDWCSSEKSPAAIKRALSSADDTVSLDGSDESKSAAGSISGCPSSTSLRGNKKIGPQQQQRRSRAGRVRTVLTEKQLHMMKSCYSANPRPDALMKEQLIEMTGLSGRVIRVWFQNKRCKDKKKSTMKMQNKEGRKMGYNGMQGFPMVASSPMRQDAMSNSPGMPPMGGGPLVGGPHGPNGMNPVDVHSYEPPWKALCDFALHSDLDRLNPNTPNYQNLVNQMHGYDYRTGSPMGGLPPHPPNSGPLGPPPHMGHMGQHGNPPPNGGPDRMYQPPPPGLEHGGQILPPMGDPMAMGPSLDGARTGMSDGNNMMVPHDRFMHDNRAISSGGMVSTSGMCGMDNTSAAQPSMEPSGYTLTSLDATSPMGSES